MTELGTYHRYANILSLEFTANRPNQKWITDITYIATQQGWCYLSLIKDLYAGFIVGHVFSQNNSVAPVTATIKQTQQKEKVTDGLVIHSDQGMLYT